MANYYINAQVKVDSSTVQTQLNNIKTKSIKLDINSNSAKTATTNMEGLDNATKNVSKSILNLGGGFGSTFLKVSKFFLITKIIQTFTQGITEAVQTVKDLDDSLIELQKVSSEAKDNLSGFTEQAFDLAESMSTSASAVTDAVTEFSKSGYGLQDSLDLAEQAMTFQTIADGAISASDSAKVLIQTMKAYSMTNSEASHIVDALNEVDKLAFLIEI